MLALRELRFGVHHVRLEPLRVPFRADIAQIIRLLSSLPVNHVTRRAFVFLFTRGDLSRISRSCYTDAHHESGKHSRHHSPSPHRPGSFHNFTSSFLLVGSFHHLLVLYSAC